jgi:chromate reductase, NAD(P)H dehydrogenase (quinone)
MIKPRRIRGKASGGAPTQRKATPRVVLTKATRRLNFRYVRMPDAEFPQPRRVPMSTVRDVAVLIGSLRKASLTRRIAHALAGLAPAELKPRMVEIGDLPLYNQDLDESPPLAWTTFRAAIKTADAVLFVTAGYNRSVPGVLKNAIDVGSRPYGASVWNGKPGAVVSVSPGAIGGFGANHHLRQSMVFLNVPMMQQPETYISGADKLFDESGNLTNEATRKFLQNFINAFAKWIDTILGD